MNRRRLAITTVASLFSVSAFAPNPFLGAKMISRSRPNFAAPNGMRTSENETSRLLAGSENTHRENAMGEVGGSDGGVISLQEQSKGRKASITLSGNAELDISTHDAPGVTIGSLAGQGSVFLGTNTLTIGSNDQSTMFPE